MSGLAGGWWLGQMLKESTTYPVGPWLLDGFLMLFAVSLAGRMLAVLWVLPVREPNASGMREIVRRLWRLRRYRWRMTAAG